MSIGMGWMSAEGGAATGWRSTRHMRVSCSSRRYEVIAHTEPAMREPHIQLYPKLSPSRCTATIVLRHDKDIELPVLREVPRHGVQDFLWVSEGAGLDECVGDFEGSSGVTYATREVRIQASVRVVGNK